MADKKKKNKAKVSQHGHFIGILALFTGFSVYALFSFFSSTDDYINNSFVSVVESNSAAPPECQSCPPFPICSSMCAEEEASEETVEVYEIFTDLKSDHPFAEGLEYLLNEGIVQGYEDGSFKPDNTINRAELLTVLTNAVDADLTGIGLSNCFIDVQEQWFAPFICYAKKMSWVNGFADGSYQPGQNVVKSEAIKIVLEAFEFDIPLAADVVEMPYDDVRSGDWYLGYATLAQEIGLSSKGPLFNAGHVMKRAEFAEMIYRAMQKSLELEQ